MTERKKGRSIKDRWASETPAQFKTKKLSKTGMERIQKIRKEVEKSRKK